MRENTWNSIKYRNIQYDNVESVALLAELPHYKSSGAYCIPIPRPMPPISRLQTTNALGESTFTTPCKRGQSVCSVQAFYKKMPHQTARDFLDTVPINQVHYWAQTSSTWRCLINYIWLRHLAAISAHILSFMVQTCFSAVYRILSHGP